MPANQQKGRPLYIDLEGACVSSCLQLARQSLGLKQAPAEAARNPRRGPIAEARALPQLTATGGARGMAVVAGRDVH